MVLFQCRRGRLAAVVGWWRPPHAPAAVAHRDLGGAAALITAGPGHSIGEEPQLRFRSLVRNAAIAHSIGLCALVDLSLSLAERVWTASRWRSAAWRSCRQPAKGVEGRPRNIRPYQPLVGTSGVCRRAMFGSEILEVGSGVTLRFLAEPDLLCGRREARGNRAGAGCNLERGIAEVLRQEKGGDVAEFSQAGSD